MSSEVVIRASAEGRLTLQIKTDMAKVSTRFKDLRVESFGGNVIFLLFTKKKKIEL